MRVAFCADVHVGQPKRLGGPVEMGLNRRGRQIVLSLKLAAQAARRRDCDALVVLGDLFDTARPSPQEIVVARDALMEGPSMVFLLVGNHDMVSTAPGDNALMALQHVKCGGTAIEVVGVPHRIVVHPGPDIGLIPFEPGDAREWLPKRVEMIAKDHPLPILGIHCGIIDSTTPKYLLDAHDAVPIELIEHIAHHHGIKVVLAGNWHERKIWLRPDLTVIQVGALCPTGWDNPGMTGYGGLFIAGDLAVTCVEIPGPRFLSSLPSSPIPSAYVRLRRPPDEVSGAIGDIAVAKVERRICDGEVEVDKTQGEQEIRQAAERARSTVAIEDAVAEYCGAMPVEEGIDRAEVAGRVRGYLSSR